MSLMTVYCCELKTHSVDCILESPLLTRDLIIVRRDSKYARNIVYLLNSLRNDLRTTSNFKWKDCPPADNGSQSFDCFFMINCNCVHINKVAISQTVIAFYNNEDNVN